MTILDENTQVVPEGLCNQLKILHAGLMHGVSWAGVDRRERELHRRTGELNRRVSNYNKKAIEYKGKHTKFTKVIAEIQKKAAQLKAREACLDDIEDNMSLAELQWRHWFPNKELHLTHVRFIVCDPVAHFGNQT